MDSALLTKIDGFLGRKHDQQLVKFLLSLDHHVIAEALDSLHKGKRKCFLLLPPEVQATVANVMHRHTQEEVLPRLPDDVLARFLHFTYEDDATDILQVLPPELRIKVLRRMREDKRKNIEKLLSFGAETAGGLMDCNFITVDTSVTIREAVASLHSHTTKHNQAPMVIAVDRHRHPVGYLPHRNLLFAFPGKRVLEILRPIPIIHQQEDREHVLNAISKRRSSLACVVDTKGRPIGVIHLSDMLNVATAEATEDIYRFAGVDTEEDIHDGIMAKVRRRNLWLLINLATAFLASAVVAVFENVIAQLAILAVYMPMVAGQGGNTATQALAVAVRGLAGGTIPPKQAWRIILRESIAGMLNGIIVGIVSAVAAIAMGADPMLGVVLGTAMVINMLVAGFFGALIPFLLKACNIDPAVASSIFVTTATDVFGFAAFLGLAAIILL